ncbi:MAG TPA: hypothetical protein VNQ77_07605 [Frankiaceae bacterium]|nr:hypothetical protein [Frankiaceae bacterium]
MRNDRGGVIVGYFTKITMVLLVFSVLCFDAVSVGAARIGVEDTARAAASEGAEAYAQTKSVAAAYKAAVETAEEHGATVVKKTFKVDAEGVVSLRVEKEATTLLLYRTKKTSTWAQVGASSRGRAV